MVKVSTRPRYIIYLHQSLIVVAFDWQPLLWPNFALEQSGCVAAAVGSATAAVAAGDVTTGFAAAGRVVVAAVVGLQRSVFVILNGVFVLTSREEWQLD